MASTKVLGRLSSRMQPLSNKLNKKNANATVSSLLSPIKSASPAAITRLNRSSRLPLELSSCGTMFPLHSAIASARLISSLSIESMSWGLVPQGISMPL
ncbi:PREDICTED: uncharacterized protein LOC104822629 [Tarenaya hassleriana]|uniref:uncharacterized protein LOC104822629 n=1 Tax=Tarenaya hassleriana TaxID=28532 RepID=UPI00053C33B2|nr:PREDICTED: uncharacterized protein LOC104822629 [Tarenaya hassleriana]